MRPFPKRGSVYVVRFDPTEGSEIKKTRPAVVVSEDAIGILPLKVIVPLTDWKERYAVAPWLVRIEPDQENHLDKVSAADAFQVRSVAHQWFVRRLGTLPDAIVQKIARALAAVLRIELGTVAMTDVRMLADTHTTRSPEHRH